MMQGLVRGHGMGLMVHPTMVTKKEEIRKRGGSDDRPGTERHFEGQPMNELHAWDLSSAPWGIQWLLDRLPQSCSDPLNIKQAEQPLTLQRVIMAAKDCLVRFLLVLPVSLI